jgi:hypothetical protein
MIIVLYRVLHLHIRLVQEVRLPDRRTEEDGSTKTSPSFRT